MPRQDAGAAVSVERFFQFSLLGLVAQRLPRPSQVRATWTRRPLRLTTSGLVLRAVLICGLGTVRPLRPAHLTIVTVAYAAFFGADYFLLSRDFLAAHGAPALLPGRNENPDRQKQSRLPVHGRHRLSWNCWRRRFCPSISTSSSSWRCTCCSPLRRSPQAKSAGPSTAPPSPRAAV